MRNQQWSAWAALGAAVGASICCVVPLALVALGIGGAWMGKLTAFEPFRPWFIALAVGLLAYAGYREYKTSRAVDCDCDMNAGTRRALLLLAVCCTAGLIATPFLIANQVTDADTNPVSTSSVAFIGDEVKKVVLEIDRMTCASCTISIDKALNRLDGVKSAVITFEPARATIEYEVAKLTVEDLVAAVNNTGFVAREHKPTKPLN